MTKYITTAVAAGALAFGVAQTPAANFINGNIQFTGSGTASVSAGITTVTPSSPMTVVADTGDYAGTGGSSVTVSPFQFNAGGNLVAPVTPEWTFTLAGITYSFNLQALTSAKINSGSPSSIAVSGVGTATMTGKDATAASWSFSGTGTSGFTFDIASMQTSALGRDTVPDGGATAMLLGLATVGFAVARRKLS